MIKKRIWIKGYSVQRDFSGIENYKLNKRKNPHDMTSKHGHTDTLKIAFTTATSATPWLQVPLTISYHLHFVHIPKVWSMLNQGSMGPVQSKEYCLMFTFTFLAFCHCFSSKKLFFSFLVLFLIKYQVSATEYQAIRNHYWW